MIVTWYHTAHASFVLGGYLGDENHQEQREEVVTESGRSQEKSATHSVNSSSILIGIGGHRR
jgi:hypothetical protein